VRVIDLQLGRGNAPASQALEVPVRLGISGMPSLGLRGWGMEASAVELFHTLIEFNLLVHQKSQYRWDLVLGLVIQLGVKAESQLFIGAR